MLPVARVTRCIADPFDRWTGVPRAVVNKTVVPSNGCRDHRDVFLSRRTNSATTRSTPACRGPWGEPSSSLAPAILPMTCPSIAPMTWDADFVGAVAHHRRRACAG